MLSLLCWLVWLIAVAINGFVIYLYLVFGLAAAAGAPVKAFLWVTAMAVASSLVVSLYFMFKGKFVIGIPLTMLWFPLGMFTGLLCGIFQKS